MPPALGRPGRSVFVAIARSWAVSTYRDVQSLWRNPVMWVVGPVLVAGLATAIAADSADDPWWAIGLSVGLLLLLSVLHLRIQIVDDALVVHVFPVYRRRIPLGHIASATAITYRPLRDFGGWGIRWGRGAVAYSMYGVRGVRLQVTGSKRDVVVGTQDPERLLAELHRLGIPVGRA